MDAGPCRSGDLQPPGSLGRKGGDLRDLRGWGMLGDFGGVWGTLGVKFGGNWGTFGGKVGALLVVRW